MLKKISGVVGSTIVTAGAMVTSAQAALPVELTTAIDENMTDVTSLATTVVIFFFGVWAVFLALKARK